MRKKSRGKSLIHRKTKAAIRFSLPFPWKIRKSRKDDFPPPLHIPLSRGNKEQIEKQDIVEKRATSIEIEKKEKQKDWERANATEKREKQRGRIDTTFTK